MNRLSLLLLSIALAAGTAGAQTTPRNYVEAGSWVSTDADIEAWYTLLANLRRNFDDICGDTFCEGDWSNIQALRMRCSVETGDGQIGRCVWIFAASNEEVDAPTGRILVDTRTWRCRAPIVRGTTLPELLTALAGDEPLYAALPHGGGSIYDGLIDCL